MKEGKKCNCILDLCRDRFSGRIKLMWPLTGDDLLSPPVGDVTSARAI